MKSVLAQFADAVINSVESILTEFEGRDTPIDTDELVVMRDKLDDIIERRKEPNDAT